MVPKILLNTQVKYYSIQEVVRFKFSTSKNMISDESSLIHVMPLHKDKEEKRRRVKRRRGRSRKDTYWILGLIPVSYTHLTLPTIYSV